VLILCGGVVNSGKRGSLTAGIPVSSCGLYIIVRTEPVYHPHNLPPSHIEAAAARVLQSQTVKHAEHDGLVNHAKGNNLAPVQGMNNIRVMD
jgi:hypothetical protein